MGAIGTKTGGSGSFGATNAVWGIRVKNSKGEVIVLDEDGDLTLGGSDADGDLLLKDKNGQPRIRAGGDEHTIRMHDQNNVQRVRLMAEPDKNAIVGKADGAKVSGVYGENSHSVGFGVFGRNTKFSSEGILGASREMEGVDAFESIGVWGLSQNTAESFGTGVRGDGGICGVLGYSLTPFQGKIESTLLGIGVMGLGGYVGVYGATSGEPDSKAGWFYGPVETGDLTVVGSKQFKLDHPLDPANKFLLHSSVESSDRVNIYNGMVKLDSKGEAWVKLPKWFEALNGDFQYQLTPIGAPAPNLHIANEISKNRFRIAGGERRMKVSWQVTGVRRDAYARAHPMRVEEKKKKAERGLFLHPMEHGKPEKKGIHFEEISRLRKQTRPAS